MLGDPDIKGPAIDDLAWLEAFAQRVFPEAEIRVSVVGVQRSGAVTVRVMPPGVHEAERKLRAMLAGLVEMRRTGRCSLEDYRACRLGWMAELAQVRSGVRCLAVPMSMLGNRDWRAIAGRWSEEVKRPLVSADGHSLN